jgi:hypothetical protein
MSRPRVFLGFVRLVNPSLFTTGWLTHVISCFAIFPRCYGGVCHGLFVVTFSVFESQVTNGRCSAVMLITSMFYTRTEIAERLGWFAYLHFF